MNEKINLYEILKDCPKGTKFYSTIFGEDTYYVGIDRYKGNPVPITVCGKYGEEQSFKLSPCGHPYADDYGECCLWPSKDCRDWSKWECPKVKKPKFDPKTLKPFDKVLGLMMSSHIWRLGFFSHKKDNESYYNIVGGNIFHTILPFNSDTEYLVGTSKEVPEFYRYWED